MAGHLLLIILIYSFHEIKAQDYFHEIQVQASLPPKLTVHPPVINETDSVTLNCQTPSSVSQCYFYTLSGGTVRALSCVQTLTGTKLLKMAHQRSPAEVKVKCYYILRNPSPESDTSSIIIKSPLPPKLTVHPPVITETDSVTLNCQTPSSVSQCYFYTLSGGIVRVLSCLQTLTGTELLKMAHQRSPAEVKVKCFYTVKLGDTNSLSPHSDTSSITIHSQKPQMSLQHFDGDVIFTCSLTGSANHDTRCNLYFGEASRPVTTENVWRKRSSTKKWFCQFIVPIDDLLRDLRFVLRKDASCDYILGREPNYLSPRSDGHSLTDIVEIESSKMQTIPVTPAKLTSGWTVGSSTVSSSSTFPTSVKPTSVTRIWKAIAVVAGCGVTLGVILLVSAIVWNQRRPGSEELKSREPQNKNSDTYHVYCEISEEPTASALKNVMYSTVKAH